MAAAIRVFLNTITLVRVENGRGQSSGRSCVQLVAHNHSAKASWNYRFDLETITGCPRGHPHHVSYLLLNHTRASSEEVSLLSRRMRNTSSAFGSMYKSLYIPRVFYFLIWLLQEGDREGSDEPSLHGRNHQL